MCEARGEKTKIEFKICRHCYNLFIFDKNKWTPCSCPDKLLNKKFVETYDRKEK
jgi:hypothetical protein